MSDSDIQHGSKIEPVPEAIAGLAVVILSILGLAGVSPAFLVAIATIVFGVELLLFGSASAAGLARILEQRPNGGALAGSPMSGLSTVFLAGVAGIVLGILALLGVASIHLVAIAIIAFGAALLISSNANMRLRIMETSAEPGDRIGAGLAEGVASDAAGMQTMSGLTAIVLGILALAGFVPVALTLVALLAMSGFGVLSSTFINNSLMKAFRVGRH